MGGRAAAYRQTSVGIGIGRYTASLAGINSLLKVSEPEVLRLVLSSMRDAILMQKGKRRRQ